MKMTTEVYKYFLECLDEWTRECVIMYEDTTISFDEYEKRKKELLEYKLKEKDIIIS